MTRLPDHLEDDLPRLSQADADLLDRLLDADAPEHAIDSGDQAKLIHLLALLDRWDASEPDDGLALRTLTRVIASKPTKLSDEDAETLDALLSLRRQGLTAGPMPPGSRERAQCVMGILSLLSRAENEPVPGGLADRTMLTVQRDRAEQKRLAMASGGSGGGWRPAGGSIRQIATTAALLMMVLSVLLPVLDKGRRDAMIAQCGQNLAGLGVDLQLLANDNKQSIDPNTAARPSKPPAVFSHLSEFASKDIDGSRVPANSVNLFVLLDERGPVRDAHRVCPAAKDQSPTAFYNGQNPVAGGPMRVFLKPRPIFADTNPLYRLTPKGLVRDATIPGMTRSNNHDGAGQNVLISDGSVSWKVRPAFHRTGRDAEDNIWLLQRPGTGDMEPDVFLTP